MKDKNQIPTKEPNSNTTPVESSVQNTIYPKTAKGFASPMPVLQINEQSTASSTQNLHPLVHKWKPWLLIVGITVLLILGGLKIFSARNSENNKFNSGVTDSSSKFAGNFDFTVYLPKNYNGPLGLTYARSLNKSTVSDSDHIPRYELFYTAKTPSGQEANTIHVKIYKGSANSFNPPDNCGNGSPNSEVYKSTDTYPCKVILKTKRGREVWGYRSPARLNQLKIDPNSDDVRGVRPEIFYVLSGETVISFRDPAGLAYNTSLTPEIVEEFVDSFEPVNSAELTKFTEANSTPKSQR